MKDKTSYLEDQKIFRKKCKLIGYINCSLGLVFLTIFIIDNLISKSNSSAPNLYFFLFIAIPIIFIGLVCIINGFLNEISLLFKKLFNLKDSEK